MHLALGECLDGEDRGAVQHAQKPVALAVVLHERFGHPQLAATHVRGEPRPVVELQQLRVVGAPQVRHPVRGAAVVVDPVEVAGHGPMEHENSLIEPGRALARLAAGDQPCDLGPAGQ